MNSDVMTAIEMTGVVDGERQIRLDNKLPFSDKTKVKVIVFYPILDAKETKLSDEQFEAEMIAFRQRLALAGYDTDEKIIELVREVKREQAKELWGV